MHIITLAGSEHQKSRLRNGHKVRVKHGRGFNVIVSPNTYHLVSRSFNKNKGVTMQLSPEEIAMNRAPSPELQAQVMGHNDHLILPTGPGGELIRGSGIGDWFKNVGNQIKSGFEDKIINPIKENIVNPVTDLYNNNVPANIRRDINTGLTFSSPVGLTADFIKKLKNGEKIQDIGKNYFDDLKHLNDTKNKVIKSSPVLTEAYKNGVMATAGLGSAALGSAFGLSPATGALAGAAGSMGARELLKAEGYGLHHAIEIGEQHHYNELKHHSKPIGGALNFGHIKDFFKHAGNAISNTVTTAMPVVKQGATMAHNFLLNNPALAEKVKEHGSKLAGMLAKIGVNYLTGNEKYGEQAENMGSKLADEQIHKNLGYGLYSGGSPPSTGNGLGTGLYAGKMRGTGPFHSFQSLQAAANGKAMANAELANMTNHIINSQIMQRPIQKYYDGDLQPRSRGTGIHPHVSNHIHQDNHLHHKDHNKDNHYNLVRGKSSLIEHASHLPPALVSQPYGANFHMQFQLPPQYHKYNDGTYTY
jgi:hypothetical protein